jgi:predicted DNA-binding ribbon-helix-helix protein
MMERLRRLSDIKDCSALERSRNKHLVLGSNVRGRAGPEVRQRSNFNYAVCKRSLALFGRKTSVSLEEPFWEALKEVAEARRTNRNALINAVAKDHQGNLSSALRVLAVEHFRAATRTKRRVRK